MQSVLRQAQIAGHTPADATPAMRDGRLLFAHYTCRTKGGARDSARAIEYRANTLCGTHTIGGNQ